MKLSTVLLSLAILGTAVSATSHAQDNPYAREYYAYVNLLSQQVASGQITQAQADYWAAQKRNQLKAQEQQEMINLMNALGAARQPAPRSNWGGFPQRQPPVNCTTWQNGQYGTINCQ